MATGLDAYLIFFVLINIVIIQLSYSLETMHSEVFLAWWLCSLHVG